MHEVLKRTGTLCYNCFLFHQFIYHSCFEYVYYLSCFLKCFLITKIEKQLFPFIEALCSCRLKSNQIDIKKSVFTPRRIILSRFIILTIYDRCWENYSSKESWNVSSLQRKQVIKEIILQFFSLLSNLLILFDKLRSFSCLYLLISCLCFLNFQIKHWFCFSYVVLQLFL